MNVSDYQSYESRQKLLKLIEVKISETTLNDHMEFS